MFAISYALIICNVLSCIPSLPAVIFPVDGDKFHASMVRFFDKMPNEMDQPLLKLLMKFQFGGLTFLYLLGAFAGYFCPTVIIGYMFAGGNFARVAFLLIKMADSEKWAMAGFGKTVNVILIVQTVLGIIIAYCTYLSSTDAEYQAYAASMAADAEAKWGTDYGYMVFLFVIHGFFTLTGLPGLFAPGFAIKNYVTVESKLPAGKPENIVLEFVMSFQQLAVLMIQIFGAAMIYYAPSVDGIAYYWLFAGIYFTTSIFCFNILNAEKYGFDMVPMLVFMFLNVFTMGASFGALLY